MCVHQSFLRFTFLLGILISCSLQLVCSGKSLRIIAQGAISNVYAGIDPLWDPIEPVDYPVPDPAFQQYFSVGQPIRIELAYNLAATDWYDEQVIPTSGIGIYDAILGGSASIAGDRFIFDSGNMSAELNNSLGEDQMGVTAYSFQFISSPIATDRIQIGLLIAAKDMLENDSLPIKVPEEWTRSIGHMTFVSQTPGLLYRVSYSVDSLSIVPEPSSAVFAIGLLIAHAFHTRSGSF